MKGKRQHYAFVGLGDGSAGWFKANRSHDAFALIAHYPLAFVLLFIIAGRARWHRDGINPVGLAVNEALIGDHDEYGMTERQYRTAKKVLEKWGLATFQGTTKGTIATLTNTTIFDIGTSRGDEKDDGLATSSRRTADGQATTNKKGKEWKEGKAVGGSQKPPVLVTVIIPENLNTVEFQRVWKEWQTYRCGLGQVKDWPGLFTKQLEFLARFDAQVATEILHNSLRNGWRGLFEPKVANQAANGAGSIPLWKQEQVLEQEIAEHPCNRDTHTLTGAETDAQWKSYKRLKDRLAEVRTAMVYGGTQ